MPAVPPPPVVYPDRQYPTLRPVPDPSDPADPLKLQGQQDAEQFRVGVEWVLIRGGLKVPLRAGYFNDRQIEPVLGGNPPRFNGFTVGTGLILGSMLFDVAYVYEFGEYSVAAEATASGELDVPPTPQPPLRYAVDDEPLLRLGHLPLQRALAALMGGDRPPLASVDTVREELRRLGYLDSSLDRFVLGGAGGTTPLRASLRAAARVGLVGGVLFGVAATLAAAGLDRRLLAEPRDLLVLARLPRRRLRAPDGPRRARRRPPRRLGAADRARARGRPGAPRRPRDGDSRGGLRRAVVAVAPRRRAASSARRPRSLSASC